MGTRHIHPHYACQGQLLVGTSLVLHQTQNLLQVTQSQYKRRSSSQLLTKRVVFTAPDRFKQSLNFELPQWKNNKLKNVSTNLNFQSFKASWGGAHLGDGVENGFPVLGCRESHI